MDNGRFSDDMGITIHKYQPPTVVALLRYLDALDETIEAQEETIATWLTGNEPNPALAEDMRRVRDEGRYRIDI